MIDGNDSTFLYFMPRSTGNAQPMRDCVLNGEYLQVDLGSQQSIGTVRIVVGSGDGDKIKKYHLEYSETGGDNSWTRLDSYTDSEAGAHLYEVNLGGESARYIFCMSFRD